MANPRPDRSRDEVERPPARPERRRPGATRSGSFAGGGLRRNRCEAAASSLSSGSIDRMRERELIPSRGLAAIPKGSSFALVASSPNPTLEIMLRLGVIATALGDAGKGPLRVPVVVLVEVVPDVPPVVALPPPRTSTGAAPPARRRPVRATQELDVVMPPGAAPGRPSPDVDVAGEVVARALRRRGAGAGSPTHASPAPRRHSDRAARRSSGRRWGREAVILENDRAVDLPEDPVDPEGIRCFNPRFPSAKSA